MKKATAQGKKWSATKILYRCC